MRHDFIDRYSRLDSPVHRIPASIKLVAALLTVMLVVTVPFPVTVFHAAVVAALFLASVLSSVPGGFLAKRLLLLEPFAVGAALLSLLQPNGLVVFLALVAKSTLCLWTMILLSNTTPFADLLDVLRRWRVPALLVTTLALMYRYLFVLIDEAERMKRARLSRTFIADRRHRWHILSTVVGQLGIRSTERAERIYAAMRARGWQ